MHELWHNHNVLNHKFLILLILYEGISAVLIYRLWTRKQRPALLERSVLTAVLLVPFLGWIFYGFLRDWPDPHGEKCPDYH